MTLLFDLTTLNTNALFQGGMLIAAFTWVLTKLKYVFYFFYSMIERRFYRRITLTDNLPEYDVLCYYLFNTKKYKKLMYKTSPSTVHLYFKKNTYNITYERPLNDSFYFFYKGTFFLLEASRKEMQNNNSSYEYKSASYKDSLHLTSLFSKSKINMLLADAEDYFLMSNPVDTSIYKIDCENSVEYKIDKKIKINNNVTFDSLFFQNKNELINDIDEFVKSKEFYSKTNITYKRGYILYGSPGNGKSAIVSAMANHIKADVFYVNKNTSLGCYNSICTLNDKLKIIVFEEFDTNDIKRNEFNKLVDKDNDRDMYGLGYATILNILDGFKSFDNVIFLFTTNYIDRIDPIIMRPGRIDVKFEVKTPTIENINEYLSWFYQKEVVLDIEKLTKDISMVKIKKICLDNINNESNCISSIKNLLNGTVIENVEISEEEKKMLEENKKMLENLDITSKEKTNGGIFEFPIPSLIS